MLLSKELKQEIFSTELDPYIEPHASTLKEVFEQGFNIDHCGFTSRHL